MEARELAFFIGLFGSVHCLGMCGPLAFSVPSVQANSLYRAFDKLTYQFGRIFSYMLLGLMAGLIGRQLWLWGIQQYLSILSGIFIMLAALTRLLKPRLQYGISGNNKWFNRLFSMLFKKNGGHFLLGILNGFLPCGFVYLSLAGAVNTERVSASVEYMFFFGLGTLPLMFIAAIGSSYIGIKVRRKLNSILPYFMFCLGVWFVLRGMNLNIPYLSPVVPVGTAICR